MKSKNQFSISLFTVFAILTYSCAGFAQTYSGVKLRSSKWYSLASDTSIDLTFEFEDFDTANYHDAQVFVYSRDKVVIPANKQGYYSAQGHAVFQPSSNRNCSIKLSIVRNGTVEAVSVVSPSALETSLNVQSTLKLNVGDVLQLRTYHNCINNIELKAASSPAVLNFGINYLGS